MIIYMVYIIGKTFPNQAQIQGRIAHKMVIPDTKSPYDSRNFAKLSDAFSGVEMFVMDDIVENLQKYQEMVKLARDNFPIVNFETFYAVNALGGKKTYGLIDERQEVRDRSRALFEAAVRLNDGKGNVNTHLVGKHLVLNSDRTNKNFHSPEEQFQETGEYLSPFKKDISLENVITFNSEPGGDEGPVLYNVGSEMADFVKMYNRFGIPMTLDTAHLAINLEHYRRFIVKRDLMAKGKTHCLILTLDQMDLGNAVKNDITNVWASEVSKLPIGAIKNVHFINGKVDNNDEYSDGYIEFSAENGRLLNLGKAFNDLTSRGDVTQMVAEAVDGPYATPEAPADYNKVPYMVKLAEEINLRLTNRFEDEVKHASS